MVIIFLHFYEKATYYADYSFLGERWGFKRKEFAPRFIPLRAASHLESVFWVCVKVTKTVLTIRLCKSNKNVEVVWSINLRQTNMPRADHSLIKIKQLYIPTHHAAKSFL